jgi:hypothetical protein
LKEMEDNNVRQKKHVLCGIASHTVCVVASPLENGTQNNAEVEARAMLKPHGGCWGVERFGLKLTLHHKGTYRLQWRFERAVNKILGDKSGSTIESVKFLVG